MVLKAYLLQISRVFGHDVPLRGLHPGVGVILGGDFRNNVVSASNPQIMHRSRALFASIVIREVGMLQHTGTLVGLVLFCRSFLHAEVNFGSLPLQVFEGGEGTFWTV